MGAFLRFLDKLADASNNAHKNKRKEPTGRKSHFKPAENIYDTTRPATEQPRAHREVHPHRRLARMPPSPPRLTAHARTTGRLLDQTFTCVLCTKHLEGTGIPCGTPTVRVCSTCLVATIVPLFERAVVDDHALPVKFLGRELEIQSFAHVFDFPIRLVSSWRQREELRRQPMAVKLYGQGPRVDGVNGRCANLVRAKTIGPGVAGCQSCKRLICSLCGHLFVVAPGPNRHVCVRGDDFVVEPRVWERREGGAVFEGGELFELGERDPARRGMLTKEERKERLWRWLEGVETPVEMGPLA